VVGVKGRLILSTPVPVSDCNITTTPSELFSLGLPESQKLAHNICTRIGRFPLCGCYREVGASDKKLAASTNLCFNTIPYTSLCAFDCPLRKLHPALSKRKHYVDHLEARLPATNTSHASAHIPLSTIGRLTDQARKCAVLGDKHWLKGREQIAIQTNTRALQPFQSRILESRLLAPGDSSVPKDLRPQQAASAQPYTRRPSTHSLLQRAH
jgi:hypothetical protein